LDAKITLSRFLLGAVGAMTMSADRVCRDPIHTRQATTASRFEQNTRLFDARGVMTDEARIRWFQTRNCEKACDETQDDGYLSHSNCGTNDGKAFGELSVPRMFWR
jgi:hypothetical protein